MTTEPTGWPHMLPCPSSDIRTKAWAIASDIERANNHDDLSIASDRVPAMIRTLVARIEQLEAQAVQPAGQEPCGWAVYDSLGFYEMHEKEAEAKNFCDHYNKRSIDPKKPYTYRAHFTSHHPEPTQAKSGAVPLTDDELLAIWVGGDERFLRPVLGKNKVLAFGRAIERAHGITQNGGSNA